MTDSPGTRADWELRCDVMPWERMLTLGDDGFAHPQAVVPATASGD